MATPSPSQSIAPLRQPYEGWRINTISPAAHDSLQDTQQGLGASILDDQMSRIAVARESRDTRAGVSSAVIVRESTWYTTWCRLLKQFGQSAEFGLVPSRGAGAPGWV